MKIGLVTLHSVDNFGSILQTYATVHILRSLGHSVEVIDYIRPVDYMLSDIFARHRYYNKNLTQKCCALAYKSFEKTFCRIRTIGFNRRHLKFTRRYSSFEELRNEPPPVDIYVSGSDQVWNSNYNEGIDRVYFLDFAPESKKRIAFSGSFGVDELGEHERCKTTELFKKYHAISVRESSGTEILRNIGIPNAKHVLDPTLVLNKSEWAKLAKPYNAESPYLLLYTVDGVISLRALAYAKAIAQRKNLQIIQVTYGGFRGGLPGCHKYFFMQSPEAFLGFLLGADFVVSVSFHGTAFSINFEKQFISVMPEKYHSRVNSLLALTGLKNRAVWSDDQDVDFFLSTIDYGPISRRIEAERKKSIEFLNSALDSNRQQNG